MRPQRVGACRPDAKCVGIGLDALFKLVAHVLRRVQVVEGRRELFVFVRKQGLRKARGLDALFGLVALHRQQRHQQTARFRFADRLHALADQALDRGSVIAQPPSQSVIVGKAKLALFVRDRGETPCDLLQARRKPGQPFVLALVDRLFDERELLQRGGIGLLEIRDLRVVGLDREIARDDPHLADRLLEILACLGDRVGAAIIFEGVADLAVAGHEGRAIGEEARHRNQHQQEDAGADRQGADQA
jgi:hypothetical protein